MKDYDRQNRDHLEKEVSPAGQMADKDGSGPIGS